MSIAVHRPETVEDAVRLMGDNPDALLLAGGQTVVAMLNTELIEPPALISLDRIVALAGIERQADGSVRIGAMTRHAEIAASDSLTGAHAVVRQAAGLIAHPAIRNLGTIGGAVSHGDPNADFPTALVAADARLNLASNSGSRVVEAGDFFQDFMTTDLRDGELLESVLLPAAPEGSRGHYEKFARVDGDYATVSVGVTLTTSGATMVQSIRIVVGACGPTPVRVPAAETGLVGGSLSDDAVASAARQIADACDPLDDVRGSAAYRRLLIPRLIEKAIQQVKGAHSASTNGSGA